MEADRKQRPMGSFFNLFDRNGKSRKKLFASNSDSPGSELGKERVANVAKSQPQMVNDRRASSTVNCSGDFSCASSVTSDEGYGTRVPGVVARLMGLDALPTSSNCEQSSNRLSNTLVRRLSQYDRSISHLRGEYNQMDYLNACTKHEIYSWESMEPRPHKVHNRPIDRFQIEVLPPKSAKSIPITSHKLLSPIRSPGFIPTKNVAYIMEAATKIIEASPKATNCKVPSFASSSIPLRIRDLKQKMEAAQSASGFQRLGTPGTAKSKRGRIGDNTQSGSGDLSSCKASIFSKEGASNRVLKNGMPASPAPQPKDIEHRRDASTSRSVSTMKQKERNSNVMIPRRQSGNEKTAPKKASERSSTNVLRKNNRKQNVTTNKDSVASKNSVSHQQGKKAQSSNVFAGPNRKVNKMPCKPEMGSKSIGLMGKESTKEKKIMSQKRQSLNDFPVEGSASGIMSFNKDVRSIKCDITIDGFKDAQKKGTDVVSFTFTSPIKSVHSSQTSSCALQASDGSDHPCSNKSLTTFAGLNLIGGDALGALLDQKLRELTNKVESSNCNMIREEEASVNASQSPLKPELNVVCDTPKRNLILFQLYPNEDNADQLDELESYSLKGSRGSVIQEWQQSEEMEDHSSNSNCSEAGEETECPDPSPVSVLEPLFKTNGGKVTSACNFKLPAQVEEAFSAMSNNETLEVEGKMELKDLALISAADLGRKQMASTSTRLKELGDYELKYLRGMLSNAHMLLEDFAIGVTAKVVNPNHFDLLENQENELERNEENDKLERKLLFDCASECLDIICGQVSFGGCQAWARLWTLFQREEWLADKLYKEILGWKSMEDLMVDELVENDMSSHYGKWVDFNSEAFKQGVEIEKDILTSLVDEVFSDLLLL